MTQHDDRFHENRFKTFAVGSAADATRPHRGGTNDVVLYDLDRDELADLLNFADRWELELRIQPWSYYFPNKTTCVCFYPSKGTP